MSISQDDYLYHYTGAAGLIGIVQNRAIWATDSEFLNDRSEGDLLRRKLREFVDAPEFWKLTGFPESHVKEFGRTLSRGRKAYIACFSRVQDSLTQFRMYAPAEGGFSIGFPRSFLARAGYLLSVDYDRGSHIEWCRRHAQDVLSKYSVMATAESEAAKADTLRQINEAIDDRILHAFACKPAEFRAEEEERLICHAVGRPLLRASRSGSLAVPYVCVPLPDEPVEIRLLNGPSRDDAMANQSLGAIARDAVLSAHPWNFSIRGTQWEFRA